MKHIYIFLLIFCFLFLLHAGCMYGQTDFSGTLQGNGLRAMFNADGRLFWNGEKSVFEAPKGSGQNTISAGGLWVGGLDEQGNLHLGAQTFGESGSDFWPGPLKLTDGTTTALESDKFNKVWYITRLQIDSFKAGLSTPASVLNWPGNGNTADGYAQGLAPFADLNSNGVYEPMNGEYPDMKGDEMLWWVFNDGLGAHTESDGLVLGVEIHASAYTFNCADEPILQNSIFVDYKIINRSPATYIDTYVGLWSDLDIGNLYNDRIGSDSVLRLYYAYNGSNDDRDTLLMSGGDSFLYKGYGKNLPAQGVLFPGGFKDQAGTTIPMHGFMYYNNDNGSGLNGNPKMTRHYYNLLQGRWQNGTSLTEGGNGTASGDEAKYAYPGELKSGSDWTDQVNKPGDRRGLGSFGPFTMTAGSEFSLSTAYLFARSPSGLTVPAVQLLKNEVNALNKLYARNALQGCTGIGFCLAGDTCVFPGDADHDGKAFMYDIFNLGLAFDETGPKRPFASSAWVGQPAPSWGRSFPNGTDYRHADTNGDGVIDSSDVLPVVLNYGSIHMKNGGRAATSADPTISLHIIEDTVIAGNYMTAEIHLGSDLEPAEDVYGIAFRISFEPSVIEPGSFVFDVTGSEMGSTDDLLMLHKYDHLGGFVDFGLTRTNKLVKDIKGLIIRWKIVIDPVVVGGKKSHAKMEMVRVVDSQLHIIPVNIQNDEVYVLSMGQGVKSRAIGTPFSIYPNPSNGNMILQLPGKSQLTGQLTIYTLQGLQVHHSETMPGKNKISLDLNHLPAGMYLIELKSAEGRTVQRFVKTN